MEGKSLERSVERENNRRVIPKNLFERKDFIPLYGIGSSLLKSGKEFLGPFSHREDSFTLALKEDLRFLLRASEFLIVVAYNLGLYGLCKFVYNSIVN